MLRTKILRVGTISRNQYSQEGYFNYEEAQGCAEDFRGYEACREKCFGEKRKNPKKDFGYAENAELRIQELKYAVDELAVYVKTWILDGHKVDRIEPESIDFPATPWDFWKQEYAPKWFLERWPVKMKTTVVNKNIHKHYVCPHINIKEDRYPHIAWMYENSGQKRD